MTIAAFLRNVIAELALRYALRREENALIRKRYYAALESMANAHGPLGGVMIPTEDDFGMHEIMTDRITAIRRIMSPQTEEVVRQAYRQALAVNPADADPTAVEIETWACVSYHELFSDWLQHKRTMVIPIIVVAP